MEVITYTYEMSIYKVPKVFLKINFCSQLFASMGATHSSAFSQ